MNKHFILLALGLLAVCCTNEKARIETAPFGVAPTGEQVTLYRLINPSGASIEAIDYGGHVISIRVPDRHGNLADVALGYDSIDEYANPENKLYIGALLGRYANRIETGQVVIAGDTVQLAPNEEVRGHINHIHGGFEGFNHKMWHAEPLMKGDTTGLRLSRTSPDGEEGYPGNLTCEVTYWWTPDNVWRIDYRATTDRPTIVCMSQHCFFNLNGFDGPSVLDHTFRVDADYYGVNTPWYIPEQVAPVEGTPFDFRTPHRFSERLDWPSIQFDRMGGYSANWFLNEYDGSLRYVATLSEDRSGRKIDVATTEPGLLLYSGHALPDHVMGKNHIPLRPCAGLILETIHHPNTPRNPDFPSCELLPGEIYQSTTEYRFGIVPN